MENWKTIPYGEKTGSFYQVSDQGRVRRVSTPTIWCPAMLIKRFTKRRDGFYQVRIPGVDGERRLSVHVLVAKAFIEGYKRGIHIHHINGDKRDNRLANLMLPVKQDPKPKEPKPTIRKPFTKTEIPAQVLDALRGQPHKKIAEITGLTIDGLRKMKIRGTTTPKNLQRIIQALEVVE